MDKPRRAQPIAALIRPALADALKAQGFAAADILGRWSEIAGDRLAAHSMPLRIAWPPRPKGVEPGAPPSPATLILKVEGAFAFEVQMAQAQIIERINAVFGWGCVGRLRLVQGPVERPARRPTPALPALAPAVERRLAERLAPIEDEALRRSLARLGAAILAGPAGRGRR